MKKGAVGKFINKVDWRTLFLSLVTVFSTGLLGSLFVSRGVKSFWYMTVRPSITPPNWVFTLVWVILFILISISLYFCLTCARNRKTCLRVEFLFAINLLLNFLWSFFYFWLRKPLFAFFDLIALWISIVAIIYYSWNINRKAALLLIPYLLWVTFAGLLNYLSILKS